MVATTLLTPYGDDAATINMVVVDASMRGRGLGRSLMEEALAKAGERTCYLMATQEGLSSSMKSWALSRRARSHSIRARRCRLMHRAMYPGARSAIMRAL